MRNENCKILSSTKRHTMGLMTIPAKDAVVWVNHDSKQVMVKTHAWGCPEEYRAFKGQHWCDPIGAAYSSWQEATNAQRVRLMLETAIDLAMQGIPLPDTLRALATIPQFRALGSQSYPMCRALTAALVGKSLEPNTMPFEELLNVYAAKESA